MADIKNFGIRGTAADVQMGKSGGRLKYDLQNGRFSLTQADGNTLEDLRIGAITSGTWQATVIGTEYGGTGQDLSNATGLVLFSDGTAGAGTVDLGNTSFVSGIVAVDNGGTGASDTANARVNLGLGTIATQDADDVSLTGGSVNGITIGGSTAAAGSFTTLAASSGITGELTGNASGNAGTATTLQTSRNFSASGDATATAVSFNGSGDVDLVLTLANSGVAAGVYGDATNIPQVTVDAKGRVTAVSNIEIATNFTIAGDNGNADVVNGGETLNVVGAVDQIATTISNNQIEISIVDGAKIANLDVQGTFHSDNITAEQISIDGDATITGNLTVQGSQVIVESTVVQTADPALKLQSNELVSDSGLDVGIVFNYFDTENRLGFFGWDQSTKKYTFLTEVTQDPQNVFAGTQAIVVADLEGNVTGNVTGNILGNVTGDVTGTVSSIANHDTDDLTEGSTNLYHTDARVETAVDAHLVGGTGINYTAGTIDLDDTAVVAGTYGDATNIPQFTVDAQGRITASSNIAISTQFTLAGDSGNSIIAGGDTATVAGGTNITTSVSSDTVTIDLDDDVTLVGNLSAVNVTGSGTLTGGTLTDGTLSITAGDITGGVDATFSGTVTGGTLTDGTLSSTAGTITGGVAATFSGTVEGATLTDGVATLIGGALNAVDVTANGTVEFGSLSDGTTTIVEFITDLDNAQANNMATAAAVKTYIDDKVGETTLTAAADTGNVSIDLDDNTLALAGGTGISTVASNTTITIDLDDTAVTASSYGAADTVATFNVDAQGRLTAASDSLIDILSTQVNDFVSAVETAVDGHLVGGTGIDYSAGTIDLADTAVVAGTYGSTTEIPTFTVDAQGRLTAANTVVISTEFGIAGDTGTDTIAGGETLTVFGAVDQIGTTVGNNSIEIFIVDGAKIANLDVSGTLHSDNITSESVTVDGDAIITGNLTVQGTQTILNTTTVETTDTIFRVNSGGDTGADVGFEANVGGDIKQILYTVADEWNFGAENVVASTFEGDLIGNADTATALSSAVTINLSSDATGTASFTAAGDQANISLTLANSGVVADTYGSATEVPVITVDEKGRVTGVTIANVASTLSIAGDSGTGNIDLLTETFTVTGGTNITTSFANSAVVINLDNDITLSGNVDASAFNGDLTGNVTASGDVSFGSLSDGTTSITTFVTEATGLGASDNDTSVPTTAAVIDFIANNAGDGLLLRSTFTADSSATSFTIGTVPNVSARTYFADKIVINVGTAFSGGSFNHILVKENDGSGTTLVAADDADAATLGTYIIELTGDETLTKNATVDVQFLQSDGTTAATTTAGSMTATVHYKYVL